MVSASIMASPNHNTSFNAMLKRCLALPPVARSCQTQTKKSPQLRGLSGISCHQVPGCARRGIIPSNIHLAITAEQITTKIHREKLLHNHLKKIEKDFDFIIIDCPPTVNVLTINAIYTSDMILIPTIYGRYSLDGIADLFKSIEDVKESSDFKYMILRNARDSRNKLSNVFVEEQLEPYRKNLLKAVIRRNEAINQAQMNNEPVMVFDPRSCGAEDFKELTEEILRYGN